MTAPASDVGRPSPRQSARARAQSLADSESSPGEGARLAGLLAADDHYDDLAIWLLDRLPAGARDETVACARQRLDWRLGRRGFDHVGDVERLSPESAAYLLVEVFRCSLPDEARQLWPPCSSVPGADGVAFDPVAIADHLAQLGASPGGSPGTAWLVLAGLPDGHVPGSAPGGAAVDLGPAVGGARTAGAGGRLAGLRRALAAVGRWTDASMPVFRAQMADGHLPRLPAHSVIIIPHGTLNRFTARHWVAVLNQACHAVVVGLVAHDPSAASAELVAALRRHAPVGVADTTSQLLLAEWGVPAVVEVVVATARGRPTLWNHAPSPDVAPWWPELWRNWAQGRCRDARAVVSLRGAWLAAQPAPMPTDWRLPPAARPPVDPGTIGSRPLTTRGATTPPIELAVTVDAQQACWAPIVIESALMHTTSPLRVHAITRGLGAEELADWIRLFDGRAELVWHPFDGVSYGDRVHLLNHTTVSTLDRLMLPSLLRDSRRVIYLDVDLVVTGDLAALWQLDLQGRPLAAKPSTSPGTRWGLQMLYQALTALPLEQALPIRSWLHASGTMRFRAFNAGVLVMDLDRLREGRVAEQCLALVEHAAMNDQDALNACVRDHYLPLDTAWNAAPRQDVTQDAKIIHFVGPIKPWHDTYISRKRDFEQVRARVARRLSGADHA